MCPECSWRIDFAVVELQDRSFASRQRRLIAGALLNMVTVGGAWTVMSLARPGPAWCLALALYSFPIMGFLLIARAVDGRLHRERLTRTRAREVPSFGRVAVPISWAGFVWIATAWLLLAKEAWKLL
jgi:hypothetical protein